MKHCEFEYKGRKCTANTSKDKPFIYQGKEIPIFSIARCKYLCPIHYRVVVRDNMRRFNKGVTIPEKLDFTRKLHYNETWSFFALQPMIQNKLKPTDIKEEQDE